jgi:hypothetical protein
VPGWIIRQVPHPRDRRAPPASTGLGRSATCFGVQYPRIFELTISVEGPRKGTSQWMTRPILF